MRSVQESFSIVKNQFVLSNGHGLGQLGPELTIKDLGGRDKAVEKITQAVFNTTGTVFARVRITEDHVRRIKAGEEGLYPGGNVIPVAIFHRFNTTEIGPWLDQHPDAHLTWQAFRHATDADGRASPCTQTREDWVEAARQRRIEEFRPHGLKRVGKEWIGACPVCGGVDRFSINPQKQVFNCRGFGGGDVIALIQHIKGFEFNDAVAFLAGQPAPSKTAQPEWIYLNAEGEPYLKVTRYVKDGKKQYPQYHIENGKWVKGKPRGPKIPYLLPQLLDSDRSEPVWFVEGEKCADRLAREGEATTTVSEGAGAEWKAELNEWFVDRIVWILPDNDEPGGKHANKVAGALDGIAREVKIIVIPGLADKGDVYDFLEGGGSVETLRELGDKATVCGPDIQIVKGIACNADGEVIEGDEPAPLAPAGNADISLEQLAQCDGLIGDIVSYVMSTARRPNVAVALMTAIGVLCTVMGRRYAGPTGLPMHLYLLILAKTGKGKEQAKTAAKRLLRTVDSGLIGPPEFTGGPALADHLYCSPLSLCVQDEFGSFLQRVNARNASGWETQLSKIYRELWGTIYEDWEGMKYARGERKIIKAPALSVLALSTQKEFFDALRSGDLTNGFINRFLAATFTGKTTKNRRPASKDVPEAIQSALKRLFGGRGDTPLGAVAMLGDQRPPEIIHTTWKDAAAEDRWESFEDEIIALIDDRDDLDSFYARTPDMANRLATIRAGGRAVINGAMAEDGSFKVDLTDVEWGIALASNSAAFMAAEAGEQMGGGVDPKHEARIKKVLEVIKGKPDITERALKRKLQRTGGAKIIDDLITQLVGDGTIAKSPKGKTFTFREAA
jgi:hypothetical protein